MFFFILNIMDIIENPPNITKKFFDEHPDKRSQIIDDCDDKIIMTNINLHIDKYFQEITVPKIQFNKHSPNDYHFWDTNHAFYYNIYEPYGSNLVLNNRISCTSSNYFYAHYTTCDTIFKLCMKNIAFHGNMLNGIKRSVIFDLHTYISDHCCNDPNNFSIIVDHYDSKNWLTCEYIIELLHLVFCREKHIQFYLKMYDICKKYNIDISNLAEDLLKKSSSFGIDGIISLFNKYLADGNDIKNYPMLFLLRTHSKKLLEYCILNNMQIADKNDSNSMRSLPYLIKNIKDDIDLVNKTINLYKQYDAYHPTEELVSILCTIDLNMVFNDQELIKLIPDDILYSVLLRGSQGTIRKFLDNGFKFNNIIYEIYNPCPKCHNGESHPCNFTYVTSNFICKSRFNVSLENLGLMTIDIDNRYDIYIKSKDDFDDENHLYVDLNDQQEVYTYDNFNINNISCTNSYTNRKYFLDVAKLGEYNYQHDNYKIYSVNY